MKTRSKNYHTNAVTALFLSILGSAPLARVAHFSFLSAFATYYSKNRVTSSTISTSLFFDSRTPLHSPTIFYNFLQMRMQTLYLLLIITFSTNYRNCRNYIMLIYSGLCFSDTCRTCFRQVYMLRGETFFLSGRDTGSIFFRETVFFWAFPKGGLLFRYRSVRRRSLGLTAIGYTGCGDTASRISFTCFTYCLPALIPLCQRRLAWWYSLWQHSSLTARQTRLSVGLSRGTLSAPAVRWPMSFDGWHYQTSAIVRHIGSLHSAGAVQFTSSLTIPNAIFSLSLLIGFSAARQTIIRYNCNILFALDFLYSCYLQSLRFRVYELISHCKGKTRPLRTAMLCKVMPFGFG